MNINKIIENHEYLIKIIIAKYKIRLNDIRYDDLMQAGRLGILAAIKIYNVNKNTKLTSLMYRIISNKINDEYNGIKTIRYGKINKTYNKNRIDNDIINIENTKEPCYYDETVLENDKQELLKKFNKSIADKYGPKCRDIIMMAFTRDNPSRVYKYIFKNYKYIKPFIRNSGKKLKYSEKHMFNFRRTFIILVKDILDENVEFKNIKELL